MRQAEIDPISVSKHAKNVTDFSFKNVSKTCVGPFFASNGSDLRNITVGQSHFLVPRAGIEPTTKRISPPRCYGVSLTLINVEF